MEENVDDIEIRALALKMAMEKLPGAEIGAVTKLAAGIEAYLRKGTNEDHARLPGESTKVAVVRLSGMVIRPSKIAAILGVSRSRISDVRRSLGIAEKRTLSPEQRAALAAHAKKARAVRAEKLSARRNMRSEIQ